MNNFNNILTKTESLRTLQGGIENFRKWWGGDDLLDTCKLYITEILQEKIAKFHRKRERAISSNHP